MNVLITIISGQANGKQIEVEFMNLARSVTWKWNTRQVGEDKYVMRFPNAKMVKEWSYFSILTMKTVEAQLLIEA